MGIHGNQWTSAPFRSRPEGGGGGPGRSGDSGRTCRLTSPLPLHLLQPRVVKTAWKEGWGGSAAAAWMPRERMRSRIARHRRITADASPIPDARMACKPDSVAPTPRRGADDHSSRPAVAGGLQRPTRIARAEGALGRNPTRSLFGLAPGGACHAADVAAGAVGSYPTVSPLPPPGGGGGLISVALSLGLPRAGVTRRHSFPESGLSSPRIAPGRGRPAIRARFV